MNHDEEIRIARGEMLQTPEPVARLRPDDVKYGTMISLQCAKMPEPKYGIVVGKSRIQGHTLVRWEESGNTTNCDLYFCKKGWVESWWYQDAHDKWWNKDTLTAVEPKR